MIEGEQGGQPERRIGRTLKPKLPGRRWVTFVVRLLHYIKPTKEVTQMSMGGLLGGFHFLEQMELMKLNA